MTAPHGWHFADVWDIAARVDPDAPALLHGDLVRTWAEFAARAHGLAAHLRAAGLVGGEKVAQYLYNGPEYLESVYACFAGGLVPVNTNFRYRDDELVHLWDNADVAAVVFAGAFADTIARIRERLPRVRHWLWVDSGDGPRPDWAETYETAAATAPDEVGPRSGDDLLLMYTGGTTGLPKGVMWRVDDLYRALSASIFKDPDEPELELAEKRLAESMPGPRLTPAPPLMHSVGLFTAMGTLCQGGAVVTVPARRFDVTALLDTLAAHRTNQLIIVGDAFARPMLEALDAHAGRWDLGALNRITSGGAMWSQSVKQRLIEYLPQLQLVDLFGSSEAFGIGASLSRAGTVAGTARFSVGRRTRVVTDDGRDVRPGSGEIGQVAVSGFQPVGYYKDPERSARTFRTIDGRRYALPGDYARVEDDGSLTLLGRGSMLINTGGEKVYPEEVEETLKLHPDVHDAAVVGRPDPALGAVVVALVAPSDGAALDPDDVTAHVRRRLAGFKAPRWTHVVDRVPRLANGKLDYAVIDATLTRLTGEPADDREDHN